MNTSIFPHRDKAKPLYRTNDKLMITRPSTDRQPIV